MLFNIILLCIGLLLLYWGGSTLIQSARRTAGLLGVSALVISLTVVAFSTSAPELLVSVMASFQGESGIALGNVIGSNIANVGLILGLALLIWPIKSDEKVLRKEYPLLIIVSVLLLLFSLDMRLERWEGYLMLLLFLLYVVYYIWTSEKSIGEKIKGVLPKDTPDFRKKVINGIVFICLSGAALILGSKLLVDSSVEIARAVGVSELVIGLSIVAIGTSLPELATVITASLKHDEKVTLGTILGSNIFNILLILSIAIIIRPITIPASFLRFDVLMMVLFSLAVYPILPKQIRTTRFFGVIFLVWYGTYIAVKFIV
ncbi:MAG: hypothetical protein A2898_05005 [Candidatus Kerfeldbacteria bacterium RIFCSPLOWO2_01_FULL_48_11]|uniref:Sodium/calcium exchanger membrane region domain-containing protein n=1 Tax=Candidatus Kerfeldbacteria bacterium RIFCSPLOWO2_01_FULL_48_11 TaxID=1798543 RepID=A0A1G2B3Z4_9BACT|nr:MAG: hypothetical protein UY34_C0006G0056 [Parcubacteria group bacterium GW2011_GWA2_48_9]KKW15654.1 MAG: hypothetical protein UY52_C0016G0031 [Parcubacteria group bacterium GW2011_GWC2_49_9]OGY82947.1 MAG: hypothetical protein A2898_05005 [Candidatus Kerfeldbacteria bacterium RIFCSPLOWO2_01_FULL_48_11]